MTYSSSDIAAYLYFGYLPARVASLPWPDGLQLADRSSSRDLAGAVAAGRLVLARIFSELSEVTTGLQAVPLSGGLDSRAILGGLLANVSRDQIVAVTFGVSGTWDYDLGRLVSKKMGVTSLTCDLQDPSQCRWQTARLVEFARQCDRPITVFDGYINDQLRRLIGSEGTFWSGFMGDPVAGSHLADRPSQTWQQARDRFLARNRYPESVLLPVDAGQWLPDEPLVGQTTLSYDEQLDFSVRQQNLIRQIVTSRQYRYQLPFLAPDWLHFMLAQPDRFRRGQRLYRLILTGLYPELFSLPTKTNYGAALGASRPIVALRKSILAGRYLAKKLVPGLPGILPHHNYFDFSQSLRQGTDFGNLVQENLVDLEAREILPRGRVTKLWQDHLACRQDHCWSLLALASLEINLKASQ